MFLNDRYEKRRTFVRLNLAERTGLEPATPGVTGRYSNQLNYHSKTCTTHLWLLVTSHQFCWWVLTGSNRRHSPCKGDALPTELSTRERQLVYSIFQTFTSAKFRNFRCLDRDRLSGTWITASTTRAFINAERSKTNQTDFLAILQCVLDRIDRAVQRASGCSLGNASRCCNCINQFRFVHLHPPSLVVKI